MNIHLEDLSFNSQYKEEYAITIEFELQRERERNKILEERLRNKEIFIVEMKKMQSQMELLTENCRAQLQEERERRNILENVTLRQYAETIAELEHTVNLLSNNNGKSANNSKPKPKRRLEKSVQKETKQQKQNKEASELLTNFANRFIDMYGVYNAEELGSLKKKLKLGWKWIKQVVKEWEQRQTALKQIIKYAQQCQNNSEHCDASLIVELASTKLNQNSSSDA